MSVTTTPPDFPGAVCAQVDPDRWLPVKGGDSRRHKALCQTCPHCADCLSWALTADPIPEGIWGGKSVLERRAMAPRERRRPAHPDPCRIYTMIRHLRGRHSSRDLTTAPSGRAGGTARDLLGPREPRDPSWIALGLRRNMTPIGPRIGCEIRLWLVDTQQATGASKPEHTDERLADLESTVAYLMSRVEGIPDGGLLRDALGDLAVADAARIARGGDA